MPWIANVPEEAARDWVCYEPTVCISIVEPGRVPPSIYDTPPKLSQFMSVLRLYFMDYDSERMHPEDAVMFTLEQAQLITKYVTAFRGYNILVHCAAGVSRSGGIVEAILSAFPEYEDHGWKRFPNGHVKRLLKRALGVVPMGAEGIMDE
jgi:predicted protein tyrosine phosphatase